MDAVSLCFDHPAVSIGITVILALVGIVSSVLLMVTNARLRERVACVTRLTDELAKLRVERQSFVSARDAEHERLNHMSAVIDTLKHEAVAKDQAIFELRRRIALAEQHERHEVAKVTRELERQIESERVRRLACERRIHSLETVLGGRDGRV